jgi:plasmid stabilization system protein ParE
MTPRYVLAPQAARDLVQIWRYVKREASQEVADRVESVIRTQCVYLASFPGAVRAAILDQHGHRSE